MKKTLGTGFLLGAAFFAAQSWADDTEIFFATQEEVVSSAPMVMLSQDWRANMGSSVCNNVDQQSCRNLFTLNGDDTLYNILRCYMDDDYFFASDRPIADANCNPSYSTVELREQLFASLALVFAELDGVKVGYMMSHDDSNHSSGGYILSGFRLFETGGAEGWDGNGNKARLLNIMKSLPHNEKTGGGNVNHPWQGGKMFFEMYRYLMGGDIHFARQGKSDFNSTTNTNIGEDCHLVPEHFKTNGEPTDELINCLNGTDSTYGTPKDVISAQGNNPDYPVSPLVRWDHSIIDSQDRYIAALGDDMSCTGIYTINALFAVEQPNSDQEFENLVAAPVLPNYGLNLPGISNRPAEEIIRRLRNFNPGEAGLDMSMATSNFVTSYFIANNPGQPHVRNKADAGGTTALGFGEDPEELVGIIGNIFKQINAVTSTFTAVSVPVNVQNRIQSLNQLFLAVFVPDEEGKAFWPGNIKRLSLELDSGSQTMQILDALGNQAFNSITGRIDDDARTFWTDPDGRDVEEPVLDEDNSVLIPAGRDGSAVNRGGAGQQVPGYLEDNIAEDNAPGTRQLFITPPDLAGTTRKDTLPLNVSTLRDDTEIQELLGLVDENGNSTSLVAEIGQALELAGHNFPNNEAQQKEAAAEAMLKWIRGIDPFTVNEDTRSWVMGDVLHSRPLTVNYGETVSDCNEDVASFDEVTRTCRPDIRIVFGTNEGKLHMVQSNDLGGSTINGDSMMGVENWAFMPREMLPNVARWMRGTSVLRDRPYGIDGAATMLTIDNNNDGKITNNRTNNAGTCTPGAEGCDKAYIYFGLRRGGKSYYALDISNPDVRPAVLWRISNEDSDFAQMGLTFSDPRSAFVRFENVSGLNEFGDDNRNVPVSTMVMGGGYYGGPGADVVPEEETNPLNYDNYIGKDNFGYCVGGGTGCVSHDAEGTAVYMVHSRTGQLIWKASRGSGTPTSTNYPVPEMIHGIAASVTPVPSQKENGLTEIFYAVDTGGNIWRIDTPLVNPSDTSTETGVNSPFRQNNWRATKLAELGMDAPGASRSAGDDRRFFAAVDVVRSRDEKGPFLGVVVASGDRAHPKSDTIPENVSAPARNHLFMIKDRITQYNPETLDAREALTMDDLLDVSNICIDDSSSQGSGECVTTADSSGLIDNGWHFELGASGEQAGEKGFTSPLIGVDPSTGNPTIAMTTYVPFSSDFFSACVPDIGFSRLYQVSLIDGSPIRHLSGTTAGTNFVREDRFQNLPPGIDGGVTAISPNEGLTSGGVQFDIGKQRPIPYYWREKGVDVLE